MTVEVNANPPEKNAHKEKLIFLAEITQALPFASKIDRMTYELKVKD